MNCLEFRRLKLAEPRRLPEEARAHANACPACRAFSQRVDESDAVLERTLTVPVPEGLPDRILLRQSNESRNRWRVFALAAGFVFAIAFGARYLMVAPSDEPAQLAIEHVLDEPQSLTTYRLAEPRLLNTIVRNFGGEIKEPLGRVRYIRLCPVGTGTGWHIVFETPQGLATLILVPGQHIAAPAAAATAGWNALVQPTPRGYYALVTESAAATSLVHRLITERIRWNA